MDWMCSASKKSDGDDGFRSRGLFFFFKSNVKSLIVLCWTNGEFYRILIFLVVDLYFKMSVNRLSDVVSLNKSRNTVVGKSSSKV